MIDLQIGMVQQAARNLDGDKDLQEIEADLRALEKAIADLKDALESITHEA